MGVFLLIGWLVFRATFSVFTPEILARCYQDDGHGDSSCD
jgi:hypothetical protein